MNLGELQTRLGTLLKVKTKRYPLDIRTEHINQAIRDLDDEFESWFSEDVIQWYTEDGTGEYSIDSKFSSSVLEFVAPLDVYYFDSDGNEQKLDQFTIEEIVNRYGSDTPGVIWPEGYDPWETGAPKAFAIYDQKIYVRPVPDRAYRLYWKFRGKKRPLVNPGDTNEWTEKEPYAVLYTAAVYGCIEVLEESRAKTFVSMAEKKISNISIRESSRMSARRPVSEEPGANTGV
jgi:hypothetical protein